MSARDLVCGAMIIVGVALCTREALAAQRPTTAPAGVLITDANFAQYAKSSDKLASYIKTHPSADMSATDKNYASADAAAKAMCDPHPEVRAAIAAGGLTCAQYFALTVELEKAAAFATMFAPGKSPPTANAVTAANIAFYRKHSVEARRVLGEIGVSDEEG